ncbi:FliM/FliN family flagellar motor switch protein [bacterium]|nr:FliM/FliN family flagellar motor switch protein [bacterium]
MIKQTQKNLETFFQCCSKPIEKILSNYVNDMSCSFKNFYEVEMAANLLQTGDVIYKFEFIINDRLNFTYVLIPEIMIAKLSDIMTGGDGNVRFNGTLTEIETNSIKNIISSITEEIMNYFSVNFQKDMVLGSDYNIYLKDMYEYDNVLSNSNTTFVASADIVLNNSDPMELKVLVNHRLLDDFMTSLGFLENSIKKIKTAIDFQQLSDIKMNITAEFGHTKLPIKCTSELTKNSLIMLDENIDEDIKVYANGLLFANAQIVLVGENFGLRLTRIIPAEERLNDK